jgi:hypothetical protein
MSDKPTKVGISKYSVSTWGMSIKAEQFGN